MVPFIFVCTLCMHAYYIKPRTNIHVTIKSKSLWINLHIHSFIFIHYQLSSFPFVFWKWMYIVKEIWKSSNHVQVEWTYRDRELMTKSFVGRMASSSTSKRWWVKNEVPYHQIIASVYQFRTHVAQLCSRRTINLILLQQNKFVTWFDMVFSWKYSFMMWMLIIELKQFIL